MKKIILTQNKYALVDDEDFKVLNKFKWWAVKTKSETFYAIRHKQGSRNTKILMHREIMKTPKGMDTDHINGDGLNNQRKNLRICTREQNGRNRKMSRTNTSGLKGVSWHKYPKQGWEVRIRIGGGKKVWVGLFPTKEEGYKAYIEASKKYHKEFARL